MWAALFLSRVYCLVVMKYSDDAIEVLRTLDGELPVVEKKRLLRVFLRRQVDRWRQYPDEAEWLAYDIAGLLATSFARQQVVRGDPYYQVLEMAGDLELPEEVASLRRPLSTWPMMARLIAALPE